MTETREWVSSGIGVNVQKVEGRAGTAVMHCTGFIDTYNCADFIRQVRAAMDQGARNLIFNLKNVNYVSSTGVGTFAAFRKEAMPFGGNIAIAAMQPKVFKVFQLLGFAKFFNLADTVEEALEFFPQERPASIVPYDKMERVTDCFGRLEVFVGKEERPSFYAELILLLKMIDDLKTA